MDKKYFWHGIIIGIVLFIGTIAYQNCSPGNVEASNLELLDLSGNPIKFETIGNGKPIIINYWATWCGPCVAELPLFQEMEKKYKDKVVFVFVSDEEVTKIEKFKTSKNYEMNFVQSKKSFQELKLNAIPQTTFYDKDGKITSTKVGGIEKEELENEILSLLK